MDLAVNGIRLMGKRHGVGRYIEYLLRHWARMERPFERICLYTPGQLEEMELPTFVDHQILRTSLSNTYWEQVVLPRHHRGQGLLFCPSYVVPLTAPGKTVVTHLGSYEAIPSAFPWHERLKTRLIYQLSAKKADLVITVSKASKADIVRFYGIAPGKIRVIPLGVDPAFRPLDDPDIILRTREKYVGNDRRYILFVGKLSKRRNIPQLISAFARLKRERQICHSLLLIGQDTVGQDVPQLARDLGIGDSVVYRAFATHEELVNVYNAADIFIYPSSYEGFGVPVLEAMACGVPAIALSNSAFVEFAKGAAYLAREGSVDELYRAMETVLFSKDLQAQMRQQGIRRAEEYGWERIARETLETLREVSQWTGRGTCLSRRP